MRDPSSIRRVLIDSTVAEGRIAQNIMKRVPRDVRIEVIDNARDVLEEHKKRGSIGLKDTLLVQKYPGRFMSSCPGSDGMVCCQYFVINFGIGCLFDCHYCYLQSFMNNPLMTIAGNFDDLIAEVETKVRGKKFPFRIGTGEYTDSLVLEPWTGISEALIEYFADLPNARLELKTKSASVDTLLNLDHKGKTVMAWSINPPPVIAAVEEGTADLDERLAAARRAEAAGYKLAFHLDPVIEYPGWKEGYGELIDRVFSEVRPDSVAWISLGSFRHSPGLKEIIQSRFPDDKLTRSEMIQGSDGKYRYFKTIREEMYTFIRRKIESVDPRLFLYLCMETRRMWESVFDFVPGSSKNLDALFEKRRMEMEDGALRP